MDKIEHTTQDKIEHIKSFGKFGITIYGKLYKVAISFEQPLERYVIPNKRRYEENYPTIREITGLREAGCCDNVTNIYFAWIKRKNTYICTELMEFGDLAKFVLSLRAKNRFNTISEQQFWFIAKSCINALFHLHSVKVVHRNVKLECFGITTHGQIKLTDFFISNDPEVQDTLFMNPASIHLYAPEVLHTKKHSYESDW